MAFLWSRFVTRGNLSEASAVRLPAGSGWWPVTSGGTQHYPVPASALSTSGLAPTFRQLVVTRYQVPSAAVLLAGQTPKLRVRWGVSSSTSTLIANTPALRWKIGYQIPAHGITLTTLAPAFRSVMRFQVPATTLTAGPFFPTLKMRLAVPSGSASLTGTTPAYRSVVRFAIPVRSLGLLGNAPSLRMLVTTRYAIPTQGMAITTSVGTLRLRYGVPARTTTLAGQVPVFTQVQKWILPIAAGLALTTLVPTFRQIYRAPTATLQAAAHTPTWRSIRRLQIQGANLTLGAQAPTLRTTFRVPSNTVAFVPRIPAWRNILRYQVPLGGVFLSSSPAGFATFDPNLPESRRLSWVLSERSTSIDLNGYRNVMQATLQERTLLVEDTRKPMLWEISERSLQGDITMALVKFAKDPAERLTLELNFSKRLLNRTIVSASTTISQLAGAAHEQSVVDAMLDGSAVSSPASSWVTQRVKDGSLGCSYLLRIKATLSDGDILVGSTQVDVQLGA